MKTLNKWVGKHNKCICFYMGYVRGSVNEQTLQYGLSQLADLNPVENLWEILDADSALHHHHQNTKVREYLLEELCSSLKQSSETWGLLFLQRRVIKKQINVSVLFTLIQYSKGNVCTLFIFGSECTFGQDKHVDTMLSHHLLLIVWGNKREREMYN